VLDLSHLCGEPLLRLLESAELLAAAVSPKALHHAIVVTQQVVADPVDYFFVNRIGIALAGRSGRARTCDRDGGQPEASVVHEETPIWSRRPPGRRRQPGSTSTDPMVGAVCVGMKPLRHPALNRRAIEATVAITTTAEKKRP